MPTSRPLRYALLANAMFSLGSGILLLVLPASLASLLGVDAPCVL